MTETDTLSKMCFIKKPRQFIISRKLKMIVVSLV